MPAGCGNSVVEYFRVGDEGNRARTRAGERAGERNAAGVGVGQRHARRAGRNEIACGDRQRHAIGEAQAADRARHVGDAVAGIGQREITRRPRVQDSSSRSRA